jgi:hypothetical protein
MDQPTLIICPSRMEVLGVPQQIVHSRRHVHNTAYGAKTGKKNIDHRLCDSLALFLRKSLKEKKLRDCRKLRADRKSDVAEQNSCRNDQKRQKIGRNVEKKKKECGYVGMAQPHSMRFT